MIVLDTNVVSEPLRPRPDPHVLAWLDEQDPRTLFLTAITVAELVAGLAALPAGRRRRQLDDAFGTQVFPLFAGRVLPFDERAGHAFGGVNASARAGGNPIGFSNAAIASIAKVQGFMLATRNVKDFRGTGIGIIDPWTA